jgi:hypothetical protein
MTAQRRERDLDLAASQQNAGSQEPAFSRYP